MNSSKHQWRNIRWTKTRRRKQTNWLSLRVELYPSWPLGILVRITARLHSCSLSLPPGLSSSRNATPSPPSAFLYLPVCRQITPPHFQSLCTVLHATWGKHNWLLASQTLSCMATMENCSADRAGFKLATVEIKTNSKQDGKMRKENYGNFWWSKPNNQVPLWVWLGRGIPVASHCFIHKGMMWHLWSYGKNAVGPPPEIWRLRPLSQPRFFKVSVSRKCLRPVVGIISMH